LICGIRPADLIVFAGRPASGKTSFVVSILANVGIRLQQPVLYFSLNGRHRFGTRLLSLEAGMDLRTFDTGRVRTHEWAALGEAVERITNSLIFLNDRALLSPSDIRNEARWVMDQHGLALIVVDDVHLLHWYSPTRGTNWPFSEIWFSLRLIAQEFEVPIVVTSRLSADLDRGTGVWPQLSDLDDHDLEDADVIVALRDPKEAGDQAADSLARSAAERFTDVMCLKNGNGPTGMTRIARSLDGSFPWPVANR
jgi:replicative DNA helicase